MGEFFHGWRRKVALVALLMACPFLSLWTICPGQWTSGDRGSIQALYCGKNSSDVYSITCGHIKWISVNESLIWTSRSKGDDGCPFLHWECEPAYGTGGCFFEFRELQWRWQSLGFGIGQFDELYLGGLVPNPFWMVPYWAIVAVLTLISAFLLILNPRKTPPTKITEPLSEKVE